MNIAEFQNIPHSSLNKLTGYGLGGRDSVPGKDPYLKICSVVDPALGIEYIMGIYPWVQTVGT
jgi:hypothetical protein